MENTVTAGAAHASLEVCNVALIEEQLRQLWRDVAQQQSETGHIVTRVCTLTLMSYGANKQLSERVKKAVPEVFSRHPARAVVIDADGKANQLSGYVSTICQLTSHTAEQVCSELITITVGEGRRTQLTSTVLPLVVPDLPLFVWWPGPWHLSSTVRNQLFARADRWIIDSADFVEPLHDLARLHGLVNAQPKTAVSDLMWARITAWRKTLAHIFDQHDMRPLLDQLTKVELYCSQAFSGGLLGLGWLAAMLDWQIQAVETISTDNLLIQYQQNERPIQAYLNWHTNHPLLEIKLMSSETPDTYVSLRLQEQGLVAQIFHRGEESQRVTEVSHIDDGTLLNRALSTHSHDRIYEATLHALDQLASFTEGATP